MSSTAVVMETSETTPASKADEVDLDDDDDDNDDHYGSCAVRLFEKEKEEETTKKKKTIKVGKRVWSRRDDASVTRALDARRRRCLDESVALVGLSSRDLDAAEVVLREARTVAGRYGLSVDTRLLDPNFQTPFVPTDLLPDRRISNDRDQMHHHHHAGGNDGDPPNNNDNHNNARYHNVVTGVFHGAASALSLFRARPGRSDPAAPYRAGDGAGGGAGDGTLRPVLSTTGGHSNTDHIVRDTGDAVLDRVAEYRRALRRRARAVRPERVGEDRWDGPRIPGGRRRRLTRERDSPAAPPEPPPSGYVLFLTQSTAKVRRDAENDARERRATAAHDQIAVVRELSRLWNRGMTSEEKDYYMDFATKAKIEYMDMIREYRATGGYAPSRTYTKLGDGPWVKRVWHEKNDLERELATYPLSAFKARPDPRLKGNGGDGEKGDVDEESSKASGEPDANVAEVSGDTETENFFDCNGIVEPPNEDDNDVTPRRKRNYISTFKQFLETGGKNGSKKRLV